VADPTATRRTVQHSAQRIAIVVAPDVDDAPPEQLVARLVHPGQPPAT
jgi:hypothetical protein